MNNTQAAPATASPAPSEREAFEATMKRLGICPSGWFDTDGSGKYLSVRVYEFWQVWQARAALAARQAPAAPPEAMQALRMAHDAIDYELNVATCDGYSGAKANKLLTTALQTLKEALAAPQEAQQPAHVGESNFESWFAAKDMAHIGTKQLARDAYAAGMSDREAQQVAPAARADEGQPLGAAPK